MTIQEACQRLGKSESTIRRWIRTGKLEGTKVGRVYDISEDAITDLATDQASDQSVVDRLSKENEYLKSLIQELEESRKRSDTIILQMTMQIESQQKLITYHEAPWWRRWFRKKKETP